MKKEIQNILDFWFVETSPEQKFQKNEAFDQTVRDRFMDTYERVVKGETKEWRTTPEGRLAEIIVLDQFSRNMFRDDAKAFEGDALALELAVEAREVGDDKKVDENKRVFFYMPYMHSESSDVHEQALEIFTEYGNKTNLEYEIKHKAIIDRFGRYPFRNEVLGRESTEEEKKFNKENGGF